MTRLSIAILEISFAVVATPVFAEALTEKQVEGVETTIRGMDCTVEDANIEAEGGGYEADDVICRPVRHDPR